VLVDSCAPGRAGGRVSADELEALDLALRGAPHYAMVFVHTIGQYGQPLLDAVGIANADEFFQVLDAYPQLRAISWGHVHQCFDTRRRGVRLLATPSTCTSSCRRRMNSPSMPAHRPIGAALQPDGTLDTEVVWVDEAAALANASGASA